MPEEWGLGGSLSLSLGLILSIYAVVRLFVSAVMGITLAIRSIREINEKVDQHATDNDNRFREISAKVDHIDDKIEKVYIILIDK